MLHRLLFLRQRSVRIVSKQLGGLCEVMSVSEYDLVDNRFSSACL